MYAELIVLQVHPHICWYTDTYCGFLTHFYGHKYSCQARQYCFSSSCIIAFGFGDPHITTTDQKTYTFNGWGEYILLETEDDSFALQGRTHLVGGATATQFNAFAFGIPSQNVTIQVSC